MLILPVLLYGAEAWTLLSTDAAALGIFERKVLRKIFQCELAMISAFDSILSCMSSSTTWTMCSVLIFSGSRRRGRPYIRWKDQIEEAMSSIIVTNWRRRARSRGAWKDVLRQAEIR